MNSRAHIFETPGERQDWETPRDFFACLANEIKFDLDVCATKANAKCQRYYTRKDNGLELPWADINWMNPPYGREIPKWVNKAAEEARLGHRTVALLPARVDTRWFHDSVCGQANEIFFLRGRLRFHGAPAPAKFPSMVVVFGHGAADHIPDAVQRALGAWATARRAK